MLETHHSTLPRERFNSTQLMDPAENLLGGCERTGGDLRTYTFSSRRTMSTPISSPEAEEGRDDQMGTTTRIKIRAEDLGRHRCFRLCCKKEEVGLILFKQRDFFFFEQRSEISRLRYFYESERKILDFVFPGISSLQLGRR